MTKETLQELLLKRQIEKPFKQKVTKVRRKVRKALKIPIFNKTAHQKAILLDVPKMYEDLLDYMVRCKYSNEAEYLGQIATFLELETIAMDHKTKLSYQVGKMEETIKLILLQHEYLDLRGRIFNN